MLNGAVLLTGLSSLLAPQAIDDPVMKIRSQRQARGESTPDGLRVVQDPPPLPPSETHVKDTKGYRAERKARAKARKGRRVKSARSKTTRKSPAKVVKKKNTRRR